MGIKSVFFIELVHKVMVAYFFHDGDPYHIAISQLICRPNLWTGFCMMGTSVTKKLSAIIEARIFFYMVSVKAEKSTVIEEHGFLYELC